jgi:hypothetical protein
MADRDPRPAADDPPRRTRESPQRPSDSCRVAESRADPGSPRVGESKYDPAAARQRGTRPLNVKIEFVVVHGPVAEELIKRQGTAVRDALQWFADHPPDETD